MLNKRSFLVLIITFCSALFPFFLYFGVLLYKEETSLYTRDFAGTIIFFVLLYLLGCSLYRKKSPANSLRHLSKSFDKQFIIAAFFSSCLFLLINTILEKANVILSFKFSQIPVYFLAASAAAFFIVYMSLEYKKKYGIIPLEQILFHFNLKSSGTNLDMVKQVFIKPVINAGFMVLFLVYILSINAEINGFAVFIPVLKFKNLFLLIAVFIVIGGIVFSAIVVELPQYILNAKKAPSLFYEEHYISPDDAEIRFPAAKRSLIVIIVESLETGFLTRENGGAFTEDLMPGITALAKNNINFSRNAGIGGFTQLYGTEWTSAGIIAFYSGIPLALSFFNRTNVSNYGQIGDVFMPGASSIGDILQNNGYKNYFFLGSDKSFAGKDKYLKTHKDTTIFDYNYFRDNNFIPKGYKVWWGIEDRKLYRFAKDKIQDIAKQGPFFISLLTADTHPDDMYFDEQTEKIFDSRQKNVLRDTDKQLSSFVEWLKEQDFYENTTVVILGDHLYQGSHLFPEEFQIQKFARRYEKENLSGDAVKIYNRYPINIFINSLLKTDNVKGREISHFDIFPLLIESIGGRYNAGGLALGRSPVSGETLIEKYGKSVINEQLRYKSEFYNALWGLKGSS